MSTGTVNRRSSSATIQQTPSAPSTQTAASTSKPASTPTASPKPQPTSAATKMVQTQANAFKTPEAGASAATTQNRQLERAKPQASSARPGLALQAKRTDGAKAPVQTVWKPKAVVDKRNGSVQVGKEEYVVGKVIGQGGMGKVQLLEPKTKGAEPLVMKTGRGITAEAHLHKAAGNHPNIAQLKGRGKVDGKSALIMEHLGGGDLQKNMAALWEKYDEGKLSHSEYMGTTQYLLKGTLQGLNHAEKNGVVHRDIKPENILLDHKTLQPKLADFGIAAKTGKASVGLTPDFASPERLQGGFSGIHGATPASHKDDIWSVGQMTHEAIEGTVYEGKSSRKWFNLGEDNWDDKLRRHGKNANNTALHKPANTAYTDFVNKTLAPTAGQRPSASDALKHKFLADPLISDQQAQSVLKNLINERTAVQPQSPATVQTPSRPYLPAPTPEDLQQIAGTRQAHAAMNQQLRSQTGGVREELDAQATKRGENVQTRSAADAKAAAKHKPLAKTNKFLAQNPQPTSDHASKQANLQPVPQNEISNRSAPALKRQAS